MDPLAFQQMLQMQQMQAAQQWSLAAPPSNPWGGPVAPAVPIAEPSVNPQPTPNQPLIGQPPHRGVTPAGVMRPPKRGDPGAVGPRSGPPAHNLEQHRLGREGIPARTGSAASGGEDAVDAMAAFGAPAAVVDTLAGVGGATTPGSWNPNQHVGGREAHHGKVSHQSVRVFVGSIPFEATKEQMEDICR